MAAASIPFEPSRALRATRSIHRGLVLGALLTGVAVAGSYSLYQARSTAERSVVVATHDIPRGAAFTAGNPEWIGKAGLLNHDIETAEEFWSFAKKFSAHPQ